MLGQIYLTVGIESIFFTPFQSPFFNQLLDLYLI